MVIKLISFIPIINVCLCLGLGVFTLTRNPKHITNIGFFLGMLSLAILSAGDATLLTAASSRKLAVYGTQISMMGQSLLPPTILLFSVVFGRADRRTTFIRWIPVILVMSVTSIVFIYLLLTDTFTSASLFNFAEDFVEISYYKSNKPIFANIGYYFYIYFIIGTILCLANLESTFRASKGLKRWQIRYVVFCVGGILIFFIYLASQTLLFQQTNIQLVLTKSIVILFCTLIMSVSIVRQKILDVDIFVSRYVVYNSVAIIGTSAYLLVVGLIFEIIKYYNIPIQYFLKVLFIFISLFILILLLSISSLRRRIQLFINRHFYKHKYEFRDTWMETIERMSVKNSIDDICNTLLEMISQIMCAQNVTIWLYNSAIQEYTVFHENNNNNSNGVKKAHALIEIIKKRKAPFLMSEQYSQISSKPNSLKEIEEILESTGAVLCSPMEAAGELVGFILQGKDIGGEPYRNDDFELLSSFSTQAALQIKNIRCAEDLSTAKEIEMFHRMSTFVMHDLKNLTNSLSLISQNAKHNIGNIEFQKDAIKTITSTVNRMHGLIERLSSLPQRIELKRELVDVKSLVDHAVKKVKSDKSKDISIETELNTIPLISIDPHAIEMAIINLVNNACDAIESNGYVKCSVWEENNIIKLSVTDNGKGISGEFIDTFLFKPFKSSKKGGFGVGLFQCKSIIESHNGRIVVSSKEGQGTTFTISLPRV